MPPKRFDQARPFVTLALALVAWLAVPVVVKSFLRASFFEFQAPLTLAASYVRDLQEYWSLRMHSNDELIQAGRDLGRLTASYEDKVQENSTLRDEITRLEGLLNLPSFADFRPEHARVIQRDFSGWWQQLVIRKGRNFGLTVGAPVIFAGGVVGRIREVHAYTSVVELISDPGVRLSAVVEGDDRPISFQGGNNPTFGPAQGLIEFVPLNVYASATIPKTLVTSGLGLFPPGLVIGQIVNVEPSPDGLFKTGEVRLDPRLSSLNEVTVLVPLNPE
ncbi:MAG TPA: rod shape-determining protein MreC [Opitutaceae bacterium]|nr:rod shape-determining protein MreC [Opitutaceae bacterium]